MPGCSLQPDDKRDVQTSASGKTKKRQRQDKQAPVTKQGINTNKQTKTPDSNEFSFLKGHN